MNLKKKDLSSKYLLLVDLFCIMLAFLLATWVRFGEIAREWFPSIFGAEFILILLLYTVIYYLFDTYSNLFKRGYLEELITIFKINCWLAVTLTLIMFAFQRGILYSRLFFVTFFLLNILITYIARLYYKVYFLAIYKKSNANSKLMIITTSDQVRYVLNHIQSENEWEYEVTYLTILDKDLIGREIDGVPVKADFLNMFEVAKQEVIDGVFIHIPNDYPLNLDLEEIIMDFQDMGATVNLSINTFGLKVHEKVVSDISGYHVLTFSNKMFTESQLLIKRMIDIAGGLVGSLLAIILILILGPIIKIESPGPIFFSQVRVGKNGRRFKIYKFRSMYMDAEERKAELLAQNEMNGLMFKIKDDPRITKVGKFIRKTSLDEFPQFFNVLKGEMSLVGTRPPTETEFLQYEGRHKRRLALNCGVTGLWQVSGRSDINDFEDVVKMDLDYIDNWSIKMDMKILVKTVGVVLFGRGSR